MGMVPMISTALRSRRKLFISWSYVPEMERLEAAATLTRAAEARREATKREAIVKVGERRLRFG